MPHNLHSPPHHNPAMEQNSVREESNASNYPLRTYIVCSTGRTGSSLLTSTLVSLGCCGRPIEYFHQKRLREQGIFDDPNRLPDYVSHLLINESKPNGVFGTKMHWEQFEVFINLAQKSLEFQNQNDLNIIHTLFPNPIFIFIRRRNTVKQAISRAIAMQTNIWGIKRNHDKPQHRGKLIFNPLQIYKHKKNIENANDEWRNFFERHSLDFIEIIYEELIDSFEKTIKEVVAFIGINSSTISSEIHMMRQKQGNDINERWYKYYERIPESFLNILYKLGKKFNIIR